MKVRCIDVGDSTWLEVGRVYELRDTPGWRPWTGYHCLKQNGCLYKSELFEPVTDEVASAHPGWEPDKDLLNLAFPCPKVDKYAEHRMKYDEVGDFYMRAQRDHDAHSGATARLHAGLEGEKVRERVKAFPKQGRNFALKGGGDE